MTAAQFRSSPTWKRAREQALRGALNCAICGNWIDVNARPRTRWAASVDHVTPLVRINLDTHEGRAWALNPQNLRVTHCGCNSRRGAGRRRAHAASEDWLGPSPRLFRADEHSIPQVCSISEAVERLRVERDDDVEVAGIDEPLEVVNNRERTVNRGDNES